MTEFAKIERQALANLLIAEGPDAPTLCAGWATRDLAAHLVVRDRRLDPIIGALVPPLARHREAARRALADSDYAGLVAQVRNPPWWSLLSNPLADEAGNALEFFIHHEDVRRAGPQWQPRTLPAEQQRGLWRIMKLTGWLALRRFGPAVTVRAPGYGELHVGTGAPQATLVGVPGELVLFLSGRQRAARVEAGGVPAVVERLRRARFGI